ncbi:sigma-54 interaction domain-containing protein [Variovorax rhizosphaerae]|uniref:Sigma 54-interacting transcriptional regulator n=1 Tax=Variovorax rhizosphaerae TaxID=1836200 RepID=A0ABU8WX32_9BURK
MQDSPGRTGDPHASVAESMRRPEQRAVEALSVLAETSEGALAVDRAGRITWISPKYVRLLGLDPRDAVVGRPVDAVIPESRMNEVMQSGKPILLDLMRFGEQHFVVCRLPLRNAAGEIDGAAGFVFYDRLDYLRPLIDKFRALETRLHHTHAALAHERKARYRLSNFIGVSEVVRNVKLRARQFAARDGAVLILGETGAGKELLAHALHLASPRAAGRFVAVNMAAVPEALLESEFFGVAPGAFTGADRKARAGKFELAHGGTLFLDEIGDMPLAIQAKLLRVLQEGEIEALGSNQVKSVDVRIVAATSRDLEAKVRDGSFRSDLFYRLNVLPLRLPPLRQRLEDIDPLCEQMLDDLPPPVDGGSWLLTDAARVMMKRHAWPGNVRELRNVLEQATALAPGRVLDTAQIAEAMGAGVDTGPAVASTTSPAVATLAEALQDAERAAITVALRAAGGAKVQAAALLGISRSQLYDKLKRHADLAPP